MTEPQVREAHPGPRPLRVYAWSVLFLAAIAVVVIWVVSSHKKPGQMTLIESQAMDMSAMKAPAGAVPVALESVATGTFEAAVTYAGTVVPYNEQEVVPRVEGWIETMPVYPGNAVRKGQLLARLSSQDVQQLSDSASAEAAAADATAAGADDEIAQAKQSVKAARAELDGAKAEATFRDVELDRMNRLFEAGAVSRSELEQERAANASAQSMLTKAQAELNSSRRMFDGSARKKTAMTAMARAGHARASSERATAGYLELRSLVDGVVTERLSSPGTLARAGSPILRVAQIDRVRLQANVSQSDAAHVMAGNPVEISTPRWPGATFHARVTSVFPAADPDSRTVVIEAVADNADRRYLPGDYVSMRIGAGSKDGVISVPDRTIGRWGNDGKPFVWVAVQSGPGNKPAYTCVMHPEVVSPKPGSCPKCGMDLVPKKTGSALTAHRVTVSLGPTNGERTVIASGLDSCDRVVIEGGADLNEGDSLFETKWTPEGPSSMPPAPVTESGGKNSKQNNMSNMPGM